MKTEIGKAIVAFVGAFFPLHSDPRLGLSFVADCNFDDYGYGDDGDTKVRDEFHFSTSVHILITRPMNNARVYGSVLSKGERTLSGTIQMEFLSSHNSCWREAITDYLNKAESVGMREFYDREEHIGWNRVHEHSGFSLFKKPTFMLMKGDDKYKRTWEKRLYEDEYAQERPVELTIEKTLTTVEAAQYMNPDPRMYTAWM